MGRTIGRYLLKEMLAPFLLGLGTFTFILLIARILKLVELVVNRGVPAWQMVRLFSYVLPAFLEVTVPMALLLAILVGLGRLSADSEVVALKACGVSLYQMAKPVLAFTLATYAFSLLLALHVRPWGNSLLKAGLYEVAKTRASVGLRERVFNTDFPGLVIYVEEIAPPGTTFRGVMISDTRDRGQRSTAVARLGMLVNNEDAQTLTLRLLDGHIESATHGTHSFHQTDFAVYDINLDWGTAIADLRPLERDPKEMTLAELQAAIESKRRGGEPALAEEVEVHRKFSIPFACLVFAVVGMPLGIQAARAGRSRGFSVSLALILAYYVLLSLAESLGERGSVRPVVALWIPNIVFALGGSYLFLAAARERTPPPLAAVEHWMVSARARIASRFTAAG